jgi:hypothetical protein
MSGKPILRCRPRAKGLFGAPARAASGDGPSHPPSGRRPKLEPANPPLGVQRTARRPDHPSGRAGKHADRTTPRGGPESTPRRTPPRREREALHGIGSLRGHQLRGRAPSGVGNCGQWFRSGRPNRSSAPSGAEHRGGRSIGSQDHGARRAPPTFGPAATAQHRGVSTAGRGRRRLPSGKHPSHPGRRPRASRARPRPAQALGPKQIAAPTAQPPSGGQRVDCNGRPFGARPRNGRTGPKAPRGPGSYGLPAGRPAICLRAGGGATDRPPAICLRAGGGATDSPANPPRSSDPNGGSRAADPRTGGGSDVEDRVGQKPKGASGDLAVATPTGRQRTSQ